MRTPTFLSFILLTLTLSSFSVAQVGINTTTPKSLFDVKSTGISNTTGILIPTIDTFPATNPGADQDGMLVFLTSATGNYKKGFHYWNNSGSRWTAYGGEWIESYNSAGENLAYAAQAAANGIAVALLDDGRMGMGTDNPDESLEIRLEGDNDIQVSSNESQTNAPNIIFYTKGGTFSSPDYLDDNDPIAELAGTTWSGIGESDVIASLTVLADGDHSSGKLPTKFNFSVTGSGDDSADDNGVEMAIRATGNIGIGTVNPSAFLHLKAGTNAPNSAPLKLKAGTNLSSAEAGAFEYDGTHLYFTPGSSRKLLLKGLSNTATLDFPNINTDNAAQLTVSVPGAATTSSCNCSPFGSIETGLKWSCYVSAANVVTIRLSNISGGSINPASKSWKVTVIE